VYTFCLLFSYLIKVVALLYFICCYQHVLVNKDIQWARIRKTRPGKYSRTYGYLFTCSWAEQLPRGAVGIVGDVGRDVPAGRRGVERRVEAVERLVGVEHFRVLVEDFAEERRAASLIRQHDHVLRRRF